MLMPNKYAVNAKVATVLSSTFLGQNGTRFAHAISGPKKVSIFRAHPFQCPS
jgi:hypothetical protein